MKKLLTVFCLMALQIFGTANAATIYFEDYFSDGLDKYILIDGDGLTASSDYDRKFGVLGKRSWFAVDYNGSKLATAISNFEPAGTADDWMISPEIEIGENVTFEWFAAILFWGRGAGPYASDGYEIYVSDNGGTSKEDFTTVIYSTESEDGSVIRSVKLDDFGFANKKVRFALHSNSTQGFGVVFEYVQIATRDKFDLKVSGTNLPVSVAAGSELNLEASVFSYSDSALTSFDMTIQEEGGEPMVKNYKISNWTYSYFVQTISDEPWRASTLGNRKISFNAGNINGVDAPDGVPEDNTQTVMTFVYDRNSGVARKPLCESFTSSASTSCYYYGEKGGLNALFDRNVDEKGLVWLRYPMKWADDNDGDGDPYFNADGEMRQEYYNVQSVPTIYADGDVYKLNVDNLSQVGVDSLFAVPGFYSISDAVYSIDENAKTVSVKAKIAPAVDYVGDDVKVYVAVFEFKTTGNAGSNGETEFHHVVQKMLPDGNGTAVTAVTPGSEQTIEFSGDMSATNVEEMSDLGVAIFVQDNITHQVYQAAYAVKSGASGAEDFSAGSGIIGLYPNPASNAANLKYAVNSPGEVAIELFDAAGNSVYRANLGNLSEGYYTYNFKNLAELSAGQYFVRLDIAGKAYNDVLNIVR